MASHSILLLVASLAVSSAFMAGGPATFLTRANRAACMPARNRGGLALRMDEAPAAPAAPKTGSRALEYSKAIAHPKPVAVDGDIRKILPHRFPFLLVDKILEYVPGEMAVGVKCITANEPQFTGHFPDRPIMPGVLQPPMAEPGQDFFFGGVDNVKWRKPLVPGDVLIMEMRVTNFKKKFGICKMEGKGYVDGLLAVEGDFTFALARS